MTAAARRCWRACAGWGRASRRRRTAWRCWASPARSAVCSASARARPSSPSRSQAMAGAGLLDGGRFRHEAARSAVLAELDAADRIHLHRRAAELAHRDGASADVVAGHLLQASHAGDPWALSAPGGGGQARARATTAWSPRSSTSRLAWRACDDERRRARIGTALVRGRMADRPRHARRPPGRADRRPAQGPPRRRRDRRPGQGAALARPHPGRPGRPGPPCASSANSANPTGRPRPSSPPPARGSAPLCPSFLPHLPEVGVPPAPPSASAAGSSPADVLADVLTDGPGDETMAAAEHILRGCRLDEVTMDTVETALLALTCTDRPTAPPRGVARSSPRPKPGARPPPGPPVGHPGRDPPPGGRPGRGGARARARPGDHPRRELGSGRGRSAGHLLLGSAPRWAGWTTACPSCNLPVPEAMLETRHGLRYLRGRGPAQPDGRPSRPRPCGTSGCAAS